LRINAVCPAIASTSMLAPLLARYPEMKAELETSHPIGRLCQPEEVAAAVVWLCSDAASFITGFPLAVDGGLIAQ
jgi:NAD(P)-dependent dehydrogenase (short-subunit alcohol dehydrogenase family)